MTKQPIASGNSDQNINLYSTLSLMKIKTHSDFIVSE